jgi:hypothetical protein
MKFFVSVLVSWLLFNTAMAQSTDTTVTGGAVTATATFPHCPDGYVLLLNGMTAVCAKPPFLPPEWK